MHDEVDGVAGRGSTDGGVALVRGAGPRPRQQGRALTAASGSSPGDATPALAGTKHGYFLSPPDQTDRVLRAAASRHVPLEAIIVAIGLVASTYLLGELLYLVRDVVMLLLVSGFVALVLNPQVVALQNWKVHRRGLAVAIVLFWAVLVFIGLAVLFGRPLVDGVTHLANGLPAYLRNAERGKGWVGQLLRRYHLDTWAEQNAQKLVTVAEGLGRPPWRSGRGRCPSSSPSVPFRPGDDAPAQRPKASIGHARLDVPRPRRQVPAAR